MLQYKYDTAKLCMEWKHIVLGLQEIGHHDKGVGKNMWVEFDLAFQQIALVGRDIIVCT